MKLAFLIDQTDDNPPKPAATSLPRRLGRKPAFWPCGPYLFSDPVDTIGRTSDVGAPVGLPHPRPRRRPPCRVHATWFGPGGAGTHCVGGPRSGVRSSRGGA